MRTEDEITDILNAAIVVLRKRNVEPDCIVLKRTDYDDLLYRMKECFPAEVVFSKVIHFKGIRVVSELEIEPKIQKLKNSYIGKMAMYIPSHTKVFDINPKIIPSTFFCIRSYNELDPTNP